MFQNFLRCFRRACVVAFVHEPFIKNILVQFPYKHFIIQQLVTTRSDEEITSTTCIVILAGLNNTIICG